MLQTCMSTWKIRIILFLSLFSFFTCLIHICLHHLFVVEGIECFDDVTGAADSSGAIVSDSRLRKVTMDKPRLRVPTVAAMK
jgi:hypothetical protein